MIHYILTDLEDRLISDLHLDTPTFLQTDRHTEIVTEGHEEDLTGEAIRDHPTVHFAESSETVKVSKSPLKGITKPHLTMRLFKKSRHERFNDFMVPNGWFVVSCIMTCVGIVILPFTFSLDMSPHVVYSVYVLLCAGVILLVMTAPSAFAGVGCCASIKSHCRKWALISCPCLRSRFAN